MQIMKWFKKKEYYTHEYMACMDNPSVMLFGESVQGFPYAKGEFFF